MKQLWKVNQELISAVKPAFCDRSPVKARRCGLPVVSNKAVEARPIDMRYLPSQVTYQEKEQRRSLCRELCKERLYRVHFIDEMSWQRISAKTSAEFQLPADVRVTETPSLKLEQKSLLRPVVHSLSRFSPICLSLLIYDLFNCTLLLSRIPYPSFTESLTS